MLAFLMDHYDWFIAALAGHVSLSGSGKVVTWVKAEYAKFLTSGKPDVSALIARITALESDAKLKNTPAQPQPPQPVAPAK